MRTAFVSALLSICVSFLAGCPASGGEDSCDQGKQGFVACGPSDSFKCQPGQYCSDSVLLECSNGCLSNVNCGCDQRCIIAPGAAAGTCELDLDPPDPGTPDAAPPAGECGDDLCTAGETAENCSADCGNLQDCENMCDSYAFFGCLAPGELEACKASCAAANESQRQQFLFCTANNSPALEEECVSRSCFAFLP